MLPKHVAPEKKLAPDCVVLPRARVANQRLILVAIGNRRIGCIDERSILGLEKAAERRFPAHLQHVALTTHAVAELPLVAKPVARDVAVIYQAIEVNIVHIPPLLPVGYLVGEIERAEA